MSAEKTSLESLRIDRARRPSAQRPSAMWPTVVCLLVAAGAGYWWTHRAHPIAVQTTLAREVAADSARTLLNASGYVTARRAATVSSKVTGKVIEVLVEEGMKVEEGQILARLDSSNVEAALRLSEAQLERSRKLMEETKPSLAFAQQELKRFENLAATKVVSDSDFRRTESEAKALVARLARQDSEIAVAEREVAQWKQQLDDTIVRAPFAGIVTTKNAQPGEMISPMSVGGFTRTGICTVVDMSSLEIVVDVNESFINRVQPKQPVLATLDAYGDWQIPAKVIAIIPTADRQKATVKVRIGFDRLDPRILPDMGAKVAFQNTASAASAAGSRQVVVSKSAISKVNDRDVAWVVHDGRVERRAVTVGQISADETSVTAGLGNGERIVINAPPGLADGARVTETKP